MDISPRKSLKRTTEPVDHWLHEEGYCRKHAPWDPTCLFRAVSEQVYLTQHYHIRVRKECVEFMRKNSEMFQKSISIPLESYLEQMSCFTESGGNNEIQAMSLLYKREFVVFNGQKLVKMAVTKNGFKDTIYLCHTGLRQYESVYAKDYIAAAAFCQSLVYQTLYTDVFKMPNVESTVKKMLHSRTNTFQHHKFFLKGNSEIREQLTAELMSKIGEGNEDVEEEKASARGNTPFPYRVAKALDPNIYRNTDFDIWQEIRREVRNAGWTRWNSSELQVGGKCLVQVDFKDDELDEANNNSQADGDKDGNGNTSKDSTRVGKREPTLLYGHIQEMSKDEGPVVVFIEALGEKKTLPFAALKPLAAKRTKQTNWSPTTCRRNTTYDSRKPCVVQKWKKTWNSPSRKYKDSVSNAAFGTKNPIDRNNNSNELSADGKTKDTAKAECWDDEPSDQTKISPLKKYTMETYNSCQGFPVENTIEVRPVTVVVDNAHPMQPSNVAPNNEDYNKKSPQSVRNPGNSENMDRVSPNVGSLPPESLIPPLQQVSLHPPSETFYPTPQMGMPPVFPGNPNMPEGSSDGNPYPLPLSCFQVEPPAPGSLMDRTIRAINFSTASNFDPNNSDLPDTVTLRFFYYFGLQCFRAGYAVMYGPNGQPIVVGPNYPPPGAVFPPSAPGEVPPPATTNEDQTSSRVSSIPRQNYSARRRNDNPPNSGKPHNGQQMTKTFNSRKNEAQESHGPRNDNASRNNNVGDSNRPSFCANPRKNGPPPRYKKNIEGQGRGRNMGPPPPRYQLDYYQQQQHHPQQQQHPQQLQEPPAGYQQNLGTMEPPTFQGAQKEQTQQQNQPMPLMQQPPLLPPPSAQAAASPGGNSMAFPPPPPPPYGSQTIYTAMPYYSGDGETYYAAPGPGFYPVPYQADIPEDNAVNAFPSHVYQPGAENYGQPMNADYPPYIYPQQSVYPGLPPQIGQENWYPIPGQPQYVQYPQCPTSQSPTNANGSPAP